jgi:hypothetical protein
MEVAMAGVTRATALEIFTQPNDLEFSIGQKGGRWGIIITRGPGHRFKWLLSTKPVFESPKAATNVVHDVLESICQWATKELCDPATLAAQIINPEDQSLETAGVLTLEDREWIIRELEQHRVASTYKKVQTP